MEITKRLFNQAFVVFAIIICFLLSSALKSITHAQSSEEATVSATVVGPSPTATATPTASPGPSASPTPTPSPTVPGVPVVAKFKIFGYAPSESSVKMNAIAVAEETQAKEDGYFEFTNLSFPTILSSKQGYYYPELCFQAIDGEKRITSNVCIPPLPFGITTDAIGPILLSPTLTLDKNIIYEGEFVKASGVTFPNATVNVSFARENIEFLPHLVPEVAAYNLPVLEIKANDKGYFEFNLPNNVTDKWKIFATSIYQESPTAKGNTLTFSVKPPILKITETIKTLTKSIAPSLYTNLIALEILIIIILVIGNKILSKKYPARAIYKGTKTIKVLQSQYEKARSEYIELLRKKGLLKEE
jgi:hypothetical protein